jgi:hypothetical protein
MIMARTPYQFHLLEMSIMSGKTTISFVIEETIISIIISIGKHKYAEIFTRDVL